MVVEQCSYNVDKNVYVQDQQGTLIVNSLVAPYCEM